jgi:hypothetical protein
MALARVVLDLQATKHVHVENYASYLANHPATDDVEIVAAECVELCARRGAVASDCSCRMHGARVRRGARRCVTGIAELATAFTRSTSVRRAATSTIRGPCAMPTARSWRRRIASNGWPGGETPAPER